MSLGEDEKKETYALKEALWQQPFFVTFLSSAGVVVVAGGSGCDGSQGLRNRTDDSCHFASKRRICLVRVGNGEGHPARLTVCQGLAALLRLFSKCRNVCTEEAVVKLSSLGCRVTCFVTRCGCVSSEFRHRWLFRAYSRTRGAF